ncbi:MAG: dienelactone hydrolase family protein [Polyangiaceae bacterium]
MLQPSTLTTDDGHSFTTELALPGAPSSAPAVIVIHEWWGLNDHIRDLTARFAADGLVAMALDLYDAPPTTDAAEAMRRANELRTADALLRIGAAARHLVEHPRGNGKVGIVGFCLGGAMALGAACQVPEISAAVPFYGIGREEFLDFAPDKAPILGHYGAQDGSVTPTRVEAMRVRAERAQARITIHMYEAGHAFMRDHDPGAYQPEAARLAWERTLSFLRRELASV